MDAKLTTEHADHAAKKERKEKEVFNRDYMIHGIIKRNRKKLIRELFSIK